MNISQQLDSFKENEQWRSLKNIDRQHHGKIKKDGILLDSFISNDYLGIASDQDRYFSFLTTLQNSNQFNGFGAASSRLLEGNASVFERFEQKVATSFQKEACLFMNSGYHANIGVLSSIPQKGDLILSDKLNHASIVDGLKLSNAHFERYKHLDYTHLERLLQKHKDHFNSIFIVSEALFSMDGDTANLKVLSQLKEKYNAHLIIDEAHSIGTFGKNGLGICEESGVLNQIDIIVAPCGKALGGVGAIVVLSQEWKDFLINTSRSFIYTTSLPPINVEWLAYNWSYILNQKVLRNRLTQLVTYFKKECLKRNLPVLSDTYIQPIIVGDNETAISLANYLESEGIYCAPIRNPTVPKNTARLRLSITVNHTETLIDKVLDLISDYLLTKKTEHENTLVKEGR
ncbi:pyridoxal phosphate-dependent aminotransferase family protein [Flammeovirga pectinis]|uniref:Pyridoxal phosphate-dependent aminotransferase family protein n=1 Tax=Flammeovirga pectinis TaxID=2494373 RepID=A0A3S9P2N0_9BACT|nr:pyridoxal phosphate-dependent aminotransferase family protein [Flammeovirga pectinis]AZQ62434.1 pyridoxal phosphate-dependent aminotransferase family protein [Flammeovirga pectinis]